MRGPSLADVSGSGILDRETSEIVKEDIAELSRGTLSRLDDNTL